MRSLAKIRVIAAITFSLALVGCSRVTDDPQLPDGVRMEDVRFHSTVLDHNVTYRVILPANIPADKKLPVVWLLHGAGDDFRSWSNHTNIAELAQHNIMLVMPDAENSYWVNAASGTHKRYENYLIDEVVPDVRRHFPAAATDRQHNAIVGISRGGFGAFVLAMKHPEIFGFVGGMSAALDLPERQFRARNFLESFGIRRAFGPMGSSTRKQNDPFLLVSKLRVGGPLPYIYLACGYQEGLLETNQRFAKSLEGVPTTRTVVTSTGTHNWTLWRSQLPTLENTLLKYFGNGPSKASQS